MLALLILLDLSLGFITVDHLVLIKLLASVVVRDTALSCFSSFLQRCFQRVAIREERPKLGITQGLILSLMLFNIYMQSFTEIIK